MRSPSGRAVSLAPVVGKKVLSEDIMQKRSAIIGIFIFAMLSCRMDDFRQSSQAEESTSDWGKTASRTSNHSLMKKRGTISVRESADAQDPSPSKTPVPRLTQTPTEDFQRPCYELTSEQLGTTMYWNIFKSRSGWKMKYPNTWYAASCTVCSDPTAAGLFVGFSPRDYSTWNEGTMLIDVRGEMEPGETEEMVLEEIRPCGYPYPIISSETCSINGNKAKRMTVDRRGNLAEYVFVVGKLKIFKLQFLSSDRMVKDMEELKHYLTFKLMAMTFEIIAT
jgi:hypothetical protein